jgi:CCR4-NOT transcription complex subunit 3
MEKFKLVEKEMKTKAFSKEGLAQSDKLDPKEKERREIDDFLSDMIASLGEQIEALEADLDNLHATNKKGKKVDKDRADRQADLDRTLERHRFHLGKLELLMRAVTNGSVGSDKVKELEEDIRYYVESNTDPLFAEDEGLYDDLDLHGDEDAFGAGNDVDRVSSQDAHSIQDDVADEKPTTAAKGKATAASDAAPNGTRRASTQLKSPLPSLAQLHQPAPASTIGATSSNMKPAPIPTRAPGEPLKYASAAAAAAASEKNGVGIAPLPPPPGAMPPPGLTPAPASLNKTQTTSPSSSPSQPIQPLKQPLAKVSDSHVSTRSPVPSHASAAAPSTSGSLPPTPALEKAENIPNHAKEPAPQSSVPAGTDRRPEVDTSPESNPPPPTPSLTNGETQDAGSEVEEESIYHLPASLHDLVESLEASANVSPGTDNLRLLHASHANAPESADADRPRYYRPQLPNPNAAPSYPQQSLSILDDSRLYHQVDPDTLFYAFYYRQGSYQQYLAARALKNQSWRFHKQYQTWFQRHEEPKQITEEYEQGTYRFFDYESTW